MLTPMDIEKKKFSKRFRGYDDVEVDEFLNLIIADYEKLYRENSSLKDKNAMIAESLSKYKTMEATMQNTLMAAQATGDEIKKNAVEKAENIIKEAELKAKEIIDRAANESRNIEHNFYEMKREFETYKIKAISVLKAQMELLESIQTKEPKRVYEDTSPPVKEEEKTAFDFEAKEDILQGDTAPLPKIEPEVAFSKRNLSYDMFKENALKTDA